MEHLASCWEALEVKMKSSFIMDNPTDHYKLCLVLRGQRLEWNLCQHGVSRQPYVWDVILLVVRSFSMDGFLDGL